VNAKEDVGGRIDWRLLSGVVVVAVATEAAGQILLPIQRTRNGVNNADCRSPT
jgi:hypothetical protein